MGEQQTPKGGPDHPTTVDAEGYKNTSARREMLWLLLGYTLIYLAIASLLANRAIEIVTRKGTPFEAADLIVFGFAYTLLFNLLSTLPLLMVIGYHGIQGAMLMEKVRGSLTQCGLPIHRVDAKMREYAERNSFQAFLLPVAVNLGFMVVLWGGVLFPHGVSGMTDHLEVEGRIQVSLDLVLRHVAVEASIRDWVFLGAFFYALTSMVRRWMQSDLTTNVLWKLNVRFAVTVLVGLLLTALFGDAASLGDRLDSRLLSLAFVAGLVPDVFLRWVAQQAKHWIGGGSTNGGLFSPSDLRKKISGMSFWQADRLVEEGIESVQDLAMKEIPDLLICTRFDPALLFNWVDRALLWNQLGPATIWFERANISRASQLVFLVERGGHRKQALTEILQSLADAQAYFRQQTVNHGTDRKPEDSTVEPPVAVPLSPAMLHNTLTGLELGPNLHYVCNYWQQTGGGEREDEAGNSGANGSQTLG